MSRKKILTQSTMINYLNHKIEELDNNKDTIEIEIYRKLIFDILKEKPSQFVETQIKNTTYKNR